MSIEDQEGRINTWWKELQQEMWEEAKEEDPEGVEEYAETMIEVRLASSDWPGVLDSGNSDVIARIMGADGVQDDWQYYGGLLTECEIDAWPLLEQQVRYLEQQIALAGKEVDRLPAFIGEEEPERLEGRVAERLKLRILTVRQVFQRKLHVLRRLMRQWMMTRHVPDLTKEEAEGIAASSPGRDLTIDAYPKDVLEVFEAVCDWIADPSNKALPHFTTKEEGAAPSLCNHVAERLHLSQKGAATKIEAVFRQVHHRFKLDLPSGGSNKHEYFESREEIEAARDFLRKRLTVK